MEFIIPLKAISMNQAYPQGKQGRRYLSQVAKRFKDSVGYYILNQGSGTLQPNTTDKFNVKIGFHFSDKRRRDVDDYFKLLLDSLTGIIWEDDSQIVALTGVKFQPELKDYIHLEIEKINL